MTILNSSLDFDQGANLVFVGGSPRSGTTMLQNMLDCHPDIAGGPEFDRVPDVVALRNMLLNSVDNGRISVFLTKDEVDREIGYFIERLFAPYTRKRNRRILSEKTPWNVLHFTALLEIFPSAKFIFCVRDPRAVVSSMLQVGKRAQSSKTAPDFTRKIGCAISMVKRCNQMGFRALRENPDRVLLVQYEELVAAPEKMTQKICSFLGILWNSEMLTPEKKKHDGEVGVDGVWYNKEMYYRAPESSRVESWRNEISTMQHIIVATAFKDDADLKSAGYVFSREQLPTWTKILEKLVSLVYDGSRWIKWRFNQIRSLSNHTSHNSKV